MNKPTITRRTLLSASALLPLAACAGQTTAQLQADVQAIATGLTGVVNALANVKGVPPGVIAQAQQIVALISASAGQIASTATPNANIVQAVANGVGALSVLLTPFFPAAPAIGVVVQAALALVPVILTAVGKPLPAGLPRASMTPDAARLVLLSAARG